jgi:hypothetical protein
MADETKDRDTAADEKLLEAAAAEWKLSEDAFSAQRTREVADQKFEAGEHFTDAELSYLKNSGKPDVVMDQTSGQVAKVTNQPVHRMVVSPNGGGADPKSAEYWQGICRRIENLSNAEDVYKWARRHAVVMGRGFWRIRPGYFTPVQRSKDGQYSLDVLQQDIRIEAILHQHSVYEDPRARQLDFSDQRFSIIASDLEWTEFSRLYPNAPYKSYGELKQAPGDCPPEWAGEKMVRVAERYYIEDQELTLCIVDINGVPTAVEKIAPDQYPKESILREHTFKIPKVKWFKYYGQKHILERADVPGLYIPVVKIVGERRIVEGKEDCRGMVRMAKGPQRLVNFYENRLASAVDLGSEGVWLASVRAVGGNTDDYTNLHKNRPAVLFFEDIDERGQPIAEPKFVHATPQVQHLVMAAQRASMSLRGVLGVPDVTPDESRPEQSGRAIRARQAEQQQATSHFGDSTKSGVRLTGRIIVEMGREIYDAARILRINGKDEKEIAVVVSNGQPSPEALQQLGLQDGQIEHMLDTGVGQFDITVTGGKTKDTGRQETVEVIESVLPMLPPPMAAKAAGTLLRNLDGAGMAELADQLSPPDDSGMVPKEQLQQFQQQAQQLIQQAEHEIAKLKQQLESGQMEADTKIKQTEIQAQADRDREAIKQRGDTEREHIKQQHETERAKIQGLAQVHAPQPNPSPELGR